MGLVSEFGPDRQDSRRFWVVLCFISLVSVSLIAGAATKNDIPIIAVTNYPLKYFAERIGGDRINVVFPIPPDVDPAFWVPEPSAVLAFQSADAILLNGATYSRWLDRVSLPRKKLVNTSRSFKDQYVPAKSFATHTHGPEGPHAHAGMAFTTWIDFQLAIQQAEVVRAVLERLVPTQNATIRSQLLSLEKGFVGLGSAN